jgi:hypothetical protein
MAEHMLVESLQYNCSPWQMLSPHLQSSTFFTWLPMCAQGGNLKHILKPISGE